jgi:hypothetical protein
MYCTYSYIPAGMYILEDTLPLPPPPHGENNSGHFYLRGEIQKGRREKSENVK